MKFSSSLKFNAIADWWDEYIGYGSLKKYIYQLEKEKHRGESYPDIEAAGERSTLLPRDGLNADHLFQTLLDQELKKITSFYIAQEQEVLDEVEELQQLVTKQEEDGFNEYYLDDDDDDDDDDESLSLSRTLSPSADTGRRRRRRSSAATATILRQCADSDITKNDPQSSRRCSVSSDGVLCDSSRTIRFKYATNFGVFKDSIPTAVQDTIWTAQTDRAYDTRLLFKRKITTLYVSISNLKSYVEVNQSGFRKILKKYDKVLDSQLKDLYMHSVLEKAYPFTRESKENLDNSTRKLVDLYTKCVSGGDRLLANKQLKLHQRENIAWERDTIWRQMIAQQRRGDEEKPAAIGALLKKPGPELFFIPTPLGTIRVTKKMIYKIISGLVLVTFLNTPVVDSKEANTCLAILVFCTFLWATEAIPLFVTSMFVPLLLVLLQVICDEDGNRLPPAAAARYVFSVMFSPTIMLLIGGFTISSALSKTNIDRVLITKVLSLAGKRPSTVILAFMGVACFASMWISNVAAPTLCFTLIRPILRTLPPKSSFGPCIILAIALAANIGGQSSPISSPQNLIALQAMDPPIDWATWFVVALPVSFISILLIWVLLLVSYRPAQSPDGEGQIEIKQIRGMKERFTHKQWWVSIVCIITIALWCVAHEIEKVVGDMGVIAIFPIVAFFSTGVLKKDDFEQFMWTIVFLAMGGIALGKGVMSSGLLDILDSLIREKLDGFSLYTVVLILSFVVLVISTFISHTVASVLLVPIAKEVGTSLPGHHKNLLIFVTGLLCSTGMGMPVSGFPNQTAATVEDEFGDLYLSNIDFLKNGVPASIIATMVVATVGFLLMRVIGL